MARPSKYETDVKDKLLLVEGWARDGLTDEQIADKLNIHAATLYEWKNRFPEFSEALKRGKEVVDIEVENALLKRALGYEYEEITIENGKETKKVKKQVPPDTTAQIFWLKNRKPTEWRDKQEINHTGGMKIEHEQHYHITQEIIERNPGLINRIFTRDNGRILEDRSGQSEPNGV